MANSETGQPSNTTKRLEESSYRKMKAAPVAVAPDSLWCCPFPAITTTARSSGGSSKAVSPANTRPSSKQDTPRKPDPPITVEGDQRVTVGFGQPETRDLQLTLCGKQGVAVRAKVHKQVLINKSSFFHARLSGRLSSPGLVEIRGCGDLDIYLETIGLMYSNNLKHALMKLCLPRVLRILKVSNSIGFRSCVDACLVYMEAVPWAREEEEQQVVAAVQRIQPTDPEIQTLRTSVLRRLLLPHPSNPPMTRILQLIEQATHDRARAQTQTLLSKLVNQVRPEPDRISPHTEAFYTACHACMHTLLVLFSHMAHKGDAVVGPAPDLASRQAEHLLWGVEMIGGRAADDVVASWAEFSELAALHPFVAQVVRRHSGRVTAGLCVAIGRGAALASSATRCALVRTWLGPLADDFRWVVTGRDERAQVEEGVCRTVLTLPMEEQGAVLMEWASRFARGGSDGWLDLRPAFEVWWKRAFVFGRQRPR